MGRSALLVIFAVLPLNFILADTVELSGGGHLTGKVKRIGDAVIVQVDDEILVAIRPSRVRRVVDSDQLQEYRSRVRNAGNDAELHYQLARWCATPNNVPGDSQRYKRYHMQRAVALDPEHANARAAVGYIKEKGKWVLTSELMRNRGLISVAGRWVLPEAVAIQESQGSTNVEAKKWIREVKRLTKNVLKKPTTARDTAKAQESLETLKAIKDPLAALAIAAQLRDSRKQGRQPRSLRLLWVNLLGRFRNGASVKALVLAAIEEQDATVREAVLEQLLKYGHSSAVATYLPLLKSKDNNVINRAARALSWFPDPELALTYVDALVTEHKKIIPAGPGTQTGFTPEGGGSFSQGSKAKVITRRLTNPAVLTLVKAIEPDADYGYDEKAWQRHFALQRTAFSGDLRRDP